MRIKKHKPSIFVVGWRLIKPPTGPAAAYMMPMEMQIAATMTSMWRASPTAVMIESSEKTRSMIAIWEMTAPKLAFCRATPEESCAAFYFGMNFLSSLHHQEKSATDQDEVAPGKILSAGADDGVGEAGNPADRRQQGKAQSKCQTKPHRPCPLRFSLRQGMRQDRQDDNIVDPEYDLQSRQSDQAGPGGRIEEEFHLRAAADAAFC